MRLLRTGTTKRPSYRLVVIDQARANKGGIIENLGLVNNLKSEEKTQLEGARITHWLSKGVVLSPSAKGVLKRAGLITVSAPAPKAKADKPKAPKK